MRFVTFEITATGVLPFECLFRSRMSCAVHSRRARRLVGLAIFAFLPELFVNASSISCAFGLKPINQHHGQGAGCFSSAALRERHRKDAGTAPLRSSMSHVARTSSISTSLPRIFAALVALRNSDVPCLLTLSAMRTPLFASAKDGRLVAVWDEGLVKQTAASIR